MTDAASPLDPDELRRRIAVCTPRTGALLRQAADEIERLRAVAVPVEPSEYLRLMEANAELRAERDQLLNLLYMAENKMAQVVIGDILRYAEGHFDKNVCAYLRMTRKIYVDAGERLAAGPGVGVGETAAAANPVAATPEPTDEQLEAVIDVLRSSTIIWASLHDERPTDYEYAELAGEIIGSLANLRAAAPTNEPTPTQAEGWRISALTPAEGWRVQVEYGDGLLTAFPVNTPKTIGEIIADHDRTWPHHAARAAVLAGPVAVVNPEPKAKE